MNRKPALQPRRFTRWTSGLACTLLGLSALALAQPTTADASAPGTAIVTTQGCYDHQLARNDDGSTSKVSLPFKLNFYGIPETAAYINNNGNITFDAPMSTYTPFTIQADTPPMIAAFFADIDTRSTQSGITSYGATTYGGRAAFCVNWRHVGYFASRADRKVDVQLILVNNDVFGDFDIVLNYNSIQWDAGQASNLSAGVGFSAGDGNPTHFYQMPGSLQTGAFLDTNPDTGLRLHSNLGPNTPGRYVYHIASGNLQATACANYYFISARGSGELATSTTDWGNSKETQAVYTAMKKAYHGNGRVEFYQLPYQALGVNVLSQGLVSLHPEDRFFNTNVPAYVNSIADGENQLAGYLNNVHRVCAEQHVSPVFILVGYSQGALVIHRTLNDFASKDPILSQIGYIGLIGDAAAVSGRHANHDYGDASTNGYGVCHAAKSFSSADLCGTGDADIRRSLQPVTETVCGSGDIICDTGKIGWNPIGIVGRIQTAASVHTTYTTNHADWLNSMGSAIPGVARMS